MKKTNTPNQIRYEKDKAILFVSFSDESCYNFTAEFLRVFSPSAEVRGHGAGNEVLQVGKKDVKINSIEPVGNYAVKLVFDDGHSSGIYSWDWFEKLGENKDKLWQEYLQKLQKQNASRTAIKTINLTNSK